MSETLYSIITFWAFKDEEIRTMEEKCRELEDEYGVKIEYVKKKKSFEIKGTNHENLNKVRDYLFKLLMSKSEKQSYGVPRYPKKVQYNIDDCVPGLPPPIEEKDIPLMTQGDNQEETEVIFRFDSRIKLSDLPKLFEWDQQDPRYHWNDICRDCQVVGDIYEDEGKVVFTKGDTESIDIAIERLKRLQKNFLRPTLKNERISIIHYTNVETIFKLCFCDTSRHAYFNHNRVADFGDIYILAPCFPIKPNMRKLSLENRIALSDRIRDYNFDIMKTMFRKGLEYVRVHQGEIRFSGCLGKVMFTKVGEEFKGKLFDYNELKDIVSKCGIKPKFHDVATSKYYIVESFHDAFKQNYTEMVEYYEIIADAKYGTSGKFTEVYMHVNKSASLRKVASKWEPLINLDWTILDRKSDLSIGLATRRIIRSDIKPFSVFASHITLDPKETSWILFQESGNLKVKSIYYKRAKRYKFESFVAEVTWVEKLSISRNSTTIMGKIGKSVPEPEIHYTIEVFSEDHKEKFKENISLGSGEIASWTVDNIIGEDPCMILFKFVKTMLSLVTTQE